MTHPVPPRRRKPPRWHQIAWGALAIYLVMAYLVMPQIGRWQGLRQDFTALEHLTETGTGLPGDPLNIALVGSEDEVVRALRAAAWVPAKALGIRSGVGIAVDTVLNKPDPAAPVSSLYLFGRRQDLAFEIPVGHSPRERHHVRFWRTGQFADGRPAWLGAATHDLGVELSRATGEVTHHIAADVDAEREFLLGGLSRANPGLTQRWIEKFNPRLAGRNGGGDPWHTDGRLPVVTLPQTHP